MTRAMDHEPVPVAVCSVCGRHLDPDGAHIPTWEDEYAAREALAAEALRESLVALTKPIRCQVGFVTPDRAAQYRRCSKTARWIRPSDDGPLAVCGTHARTRRESRYRGEKNVFRGGPIPAADEALT